MAWKKAPEALIELFGHVVPDDKRVERRQMFGYPACFTGGNMFMGLHEHRMVLRLPEDARAGFLSLPGAVIFEPMAGRPMREYVVAPPSLLTNREQLSLWALRALDYAASLPKKEKKAAKKPATKKAAKSSAEKPTRKKR